MSAWNLAAQPRGSIDDHRIEAARVPLLGLPQQFRPSGPVVPPPGLLIGELADDLSAQLLRLRRASFPLRREGERRACLPLVESRPYQAKRRLAPAADRDRFSAAIDRLLRRSRPIALSLCRAYPEPVKIAQPSRSQQARRVGGEEAKTTRAAREGGGESDAPIDQREPPLGRVEAAPRRQSPGGKEGRRCAQG